MTTRSRCGVDHRLSNNELFRMIAIDKKYNQSFLLTFILLGHFSLKNCLIAQASTYSGASNAQMNNEKRCSANNSNGFHIYFSIPPFALRFFRHGTFGWTATQVHEKIVTRQLQIMFKIDVQCERSV